MTSDTVGKWYSQKRFRWWWITGSDNHLISLKQSLLSCTCVSKWTKNTK